MKNLKTIADMQPGSFGKIHSYKDQTPFTIRLQEMGLLPGTHIQLLRKAPLGDPLEIAVIKQFQLTINKREAGQIFINY